MKLAKGGIKSGLKLFYPPPSASYDPHEFAAWLKSFGEKLIIAGLGNVSIIPLVGGNESLFVGIETDEATGAAIKRAIYN